MTDAGVLAAQTRSGDRLVRDTVAGAVTLARAQAERLNATVLIDEERALQRADELDGRIQRGQDIGPLAGVPIAIKDIIDHAGRPTRCGSGFFERIPERSAPVVDRLEEAGAVIVSRTGLHEFAYGFSSENPWTGPVRNPLDSDLSPGGSSGGSAAAVGGGQVPIALGSDTGGSVRVPAALCGVYGLKVTHGRVPTTGVFPLAESLDTVGPIAATVADLALAYRVIAGHEASDPWSRPQPVVTPAGPRPDLNGLRVGVPSRWIDEAPVVDAVGDAFVAAVARLVELGATVVDIDDPALAPDRVLVDVSAAEAASVHRGWLADGKPYGDEVAERLAYALEVDVDTYVAARRWQSEITARAAEAFLGVDLLVTPATGATRKQIGVDRIDVAGKDVPYRPVLSCFSALVNIIGAPALVGPIEGDVNPPPSLQLIAPRWHEHRLLEVAATLVAAEVFRTPSS